MPLSLGLSRPRPVRQRPGGARAAQQQGAQQESCAASAQAQDQSDADQKVRVGRERAANELKQDMNGCLDDAAKESFEGLIESTVQMEKEAEAYMQYCVSIDQFFQSFQQSWMNSSLYVLSSATICFLPFQCLTGLWGMNFTGEDGKAMPELSFTYGYTMFWCLAGTFLLLGFLYMYKASLSSQQGAVILMSEEDKDEDEAVSREVDNRVNQLTSGSSVLRQGTFKHRSANGSASSTPSSSVMRSSNNNTNPGAHSSEGGAVGSNQVAPSPFSDNLPVVVLD
eukprot:CAMPEP_0114170458 /NCGR_PEP_ID=MMETSP0043_2-20121206/34159_1 /TAXON_ID=464988 /ORGANISM="Hemiselmis andersenii, Strain CCMP644" /LENGTH=281 /DNA_ID=CAMNT_0001268081 /DNA_START=287 /DNA_END=1133 /DNA_ORIENTATION=+